MKHLFIFLLALSILSGCDTDSSRISSENRGLWIDENEVEALNLIEDQIAQRKDPYQACKTFNVETEGPRFFQVESIRVHRSGLVTPFIANNDGIFEPSGLNSELGRIEEDGTFKEFGKLATLLSESPSYVKFLEGDLLALTRYRIGTFGTEHEELTYYRKTNEIEMVEFNELLTTFCR